MFEIGAVVLEMKLKMLKDFDDNDINETTITTPTTGQWTNLGQKSLLESIKTHIFSDIYKNGYKRCINCWMVYWCYLIDCLFMIDTKIFFFLKRCIKLAKNIHIRLTIDVLIDKDISMFFR